MELKDDKRTVEIIVFFNLTLMKYFPIHILFKDFSFLISYFILMKYNLTGEILLPSAKSNFPGATDMKFVDMLAATLFYFWPAIIVSFATYFVILFFCNKLLIDNSIFSKLLTAFLLSLSTPILFMYMNKWKWNDYYEIKAGIISWISYFTISILMYIFLNRNIKDKEELIK